MSGERPERLGWLYGLVVVAVAAVGAAAGRMFVANDLGFARPWARAYTVCLRRFGDWPAQLDAFESCIAPSEDPRGWAMLAGAVVALGVVALLVVLMPVVDRRRLSAHRSRSAPPEVWARFDALVAASGLADRRPELVVANPPVRQSFTTVSAAGRPVVVVPVALALAADGHERFDAVVHHELGHVRAGDARWVSVVRGLAWVLVPAFGVALVPALPVWLAHPVPSAVGTQVPLAVRTVLLVLITAVLSGVLLRAREISCDRYAVRMGAEQALIRMLRNAPAPRPGVLGRVFARHPSPRQRLAALPAGGRPVTGSGLQGFVTGLVAMVAAGAATQPAVAWFATATGWLGQATGAAVVGAVLAGTLFPALIRAAVQARAASARVRWWCPAVGVAAGVLAGDVVSPVLGGPLMSAFPMQGNSLGLHASATVLIAVAAGAGVAWCAALAELLAEVRMDPGRGLRALVAVAAGAATGFLVWLSAVVATVFTDLALVRRWLVFALASPPSLYAVLPALLVPVTVVVVSRGAGTAFRWRRVLWVAGTAVLAGALVSVLWTWAWPPLTVDEALRMREGRWWVSTLTGWVVLVTAAPRAGAARALLLSWSAGALVGAVQYGHVLLDYRDHGWADLRQLVMTPVAWLICLTALTLPVFFAGRGREVAGAGSSSRWLPAGSGLLAGALAVVAMGPGIPGAFAEVPPDASTVTASVPDALLSPASRSPRRDPGRVLSTAEAGDIVAAAGRVLPAYWRRLDDPDPPAAKPAIEPPSCRPLGHDEYVAALAPGMKASRAGVYETERVTPAVFSTLTVDVSSYATPVPASVFAAAEAARAACARYTATQDGFTVTFRVSSGPVPALGEQVFRVDFDLSAPGVTGRTVFVMARVGHSLVSVSMFATGEGVDEQRLLATLTAAVSALG